MDERAAKIGELLHEAAETHHRVFRITDGEDDDWASWYSEWLVSLSELPGLLGGKVVRSELTYMLVRLDKEYTERHPPGRWEDFYAGELVRHFGDWVATLALIAAAFALTHGDQAAVAVVLVLRPGARAHGRGPRALAGVRRRRGLRGGVFRGHRPGPDHGAGAGLQRGPRQDHGRRADAVPGGAGPRGARDRRAGPRRRRLGALARRRRQPGRAPGRGRPD